jgi:hypothetical protein
MRDDYFNRSGIDSVSILRIEFLLLTRAPVVELADTLDSGSSARKGVEVRLLSGVPF